MYTSRWQVHHLPPRREEEELAAELIGYTAWLQPGWLYWLPFGPPMLLAAPLVAGAASYTSSGMSTSQLSAGSFREAGRHRVER